MSNRTQLFLFAPQNAEVWKPVRGYERFYLVSDLGRVKYIVARGGRSNDGRGGRTKAGAIKTLSESRLGYLYTSLTNEHGKDKKYFIHRLVMEAFSPREDMVDLDVNHVDGDPQNNRFSNLEGMSHAENMRHARTVLKSWDRYKYHRYRVTLNQHEELRAILSATDETYTEFIHRLICQEALRLNLPYQGEDVNRKRRGATYKDENPNGKRHRPSTRPLF